MKYFFGAVCSALVAVALTSTANAANFSFARSSVGKEVLLGDSEFFDRLSPADINIRLGTTGEDSDRDALKESYALGVEEWTQDDILAIVPAIAASRSLLDPYEDLLPEEIYLVKTNNRIDGGLPHTRGNAIFFNPNGGSFTLELLLHEVFHILSRRHRDKEASLYALIGFEACSVSPLGELDDHRLTNPDTRADEYFVRTGDGGVVPTIFADTKRFDPQLGSFGAHLRFALLKVTVEEGSCVPVPGNRIGARLLQASDVPEYYEAIGRNTGYIIHPEEVLADNFVALLKKSEGLPNPEIPKRLQAWLNGL